MPIEQDRDDLMYYRENYFDEYANDQKTKHRIKLYQNILNDIEKRKKRGDILDVGCGLGLFLKEAKDRGWEITGIDPSEESIQFAKELIGNDAFTGILKNLNRNHLYDVITSINVLDQFEESWNEIPMMKSLLKPGGIVYLRFPNGVFHASILRLFLKFSSKPYINQFLVFNRYVFTRGFIQRVLSDTGFSNVYIRNATLSGAGLYQRLFTLKATGVFINYIVWHFVRFLEIISRGRILWSPSLQVTAINS
jgi:2-polyprenyl-3-methyl-5-hydroxy-6-metoxy-1,4-benzoquinol methylase